MPQFHPVTVKNIRAETDNAVVLSLAPQSGNFSFSPGQYLTFRKDFAGTELRRCYSICSARGEGLQVAVKAVDGGAFSGFANRQLKAGDVLEAMEPAGNFGKTVGHNNLGIAGGSGITPLISIIKSTLQSDEAASFTLVYANKSAASTMFRGALQDLKDMFLERLQLIHILEDNAQDIPLFSGRITPEKMKTLCENWINIGQIDRAFICGPTPMMEVVKAGLADFMPPSQISVEHFLPNQLGRLDQPIGPTPNNTPQSKVSLTVKIDGVSHKIKQSPNDTILEAVLNAKLDAPYACRAGVCSTCKAKLLKGKVEMRANQALEDYEVEAGAILTCQSLVITKEAEVDYDQI